MKELAINRDDGLPEFESHLGDAALGGSTLVMPNSLKSGGAIGISLALTQLLLTWARRTANGTIRSYLPAEDKDAMEDFVGRAHGLAAAYFAATVLADRSSTNIRQLLMESARPRIRAMHNADLSRTARGPEIELISVQGARAEFHGSLYAQAPAPSDILDRERHGRYVRDCSEMNAFMAKCVDVLGLTKQLGASLRDRMEPFGVLLHETFRNSAEHGYLAVDGSRLKQNFRCVRLAQSLLAREDVARMAVSAPTSRPTADLYFSGLARKEGYGSHNKVTFFELSVFDSGPGFAPTINRFGNTAREDRDAVSRCFLKHQTAKASPTAGLGLSRILEVVRAKYGFLRVRTNTVEAFYAPVGELEVPTDPTSFVHDGLPSVEGTLVTVAIPVSY